MPVPVTLETLDPGPEGKIVKKFYDLLSADASFTSCFKNIRLCESYRDLMAFDQGSLGIWHLPTPATPLPSQREDIQIDIMLVAHLLLEEPTVESPLIALRLKNLIRTFVCANDVLTDTDNTQMSFALPFTTFAMDFADEKLRQRRLGYRVTYKSQIDPTTGAFA